jgi:hypothetical protein
MRPRVPRGLLPSLLVATLIIGCDSPTRPGDPSSLSFGRAVTSHLAPGDSQVFHLDAKAGQSFAVYLQSSAYTTILLRDPAQKLSGGAAATPGDTATMRDGVSTTAVADGRYTIVVGPSRNASDADFTVRANLVDPAPEHVKQTVALGSVVTGERVDAGFDQDQFIIELPSATEAELYLHADGLPQVPLVRLIVSLRRVGVPSTIYEDALYPPIGTSDFEQLSSGHLTLAAGKYALTVSGTYGIPYSFQLRPVIRAPEHAAAVLTPGDTISEAIDYVGDIDEYVLRGTPGAEYEVFVAATGATPHEVHVSFPELDPSGAVRTYTVLDRPLLDAATGRVAMPASGQLTVQVTDAGDHGIYRGPYRLAAVAIDRHPEGQSDVIAPSNSVLAGALEVYGDVDEYRLVLGTPTRLTLRCAPTPPAGCTAIGAAVYDDAAPSTPVSLGGSALAPGSYRLHVESRPGFGGPATANGMYRGPYQVVLATKDSTPEDAPAGLAVGTPVTESLTWPWDDDTFTFDVATADTLVMHLTMVDALGGTYRVDLRDAITGADVAPTGRYGELPTEKRWPLGAGHYAVTISWGSAPWAPGKRGKYDFELQRVSAAPEGRSPDVAVGDTVDGYFDLPGDIDDYVLRGIPGKLFSLHLFNVASPSGLGWSSVVIRDSTTGEMLANPWKTIAPVISQALTMPPDGVLRLRVCPEPGCASEVVGYPYRFSVDPVDPAPESRAAQFTFGDTVTDAIEHPADIDEFTFDGTTGQSVDVVVLQATGVFPGAANVVLLVIDETSGEQVARLVLDSYAVESGTDVLRGVALSHTGRYRIRVQGDPASTYLGATGSYRFVVTAR